MIYSIYELKVQIGHRVYKLKIHVYSELRYIVGFDQSTGNNNKVFF